MLKAVLILAFYVPATLLASPSSRCPVTENGKKPLLPLGFEVSEVTTSKNKDIYTIAPSQENPYGGAKQVWIAHKDQSGKITRIESGGETPSQKLIQYELKKRGIQLEAQLEVPKNDKKFSIPGIEDVKMAIAQPDDFSIKFGSTVEMKYSDSKCNVVEISERRYHPRDKKTDSEKLFSANKCDEIRKVYATTTDELAYCSKTKSIHSNKITQILNADPGVGGVGGGSGYAPGVGGVGGGSGEPTRDIANSGITVSNNAVATNIVSPIHLQDYLHSSANGSSESFTDLNYCDYFAPVGRYETKPIEKPGSATKQ